MIYKLGIDVGSTTLKTIVLNENNEIIEKSYIRHYSKVRELTREHIKSLEDLLKGKKVKVSVTGSAGLGVAKASGLEFAQEVFATAGAVKKLYPAADVVIELGGEDAKILFLKGTLEERMNGTCAGGTGAFIDQMVTLLNITGEELDTLSFGHEKIYPIASRCGVFAKSDIQPLINQGARKEDIAASIFQAVVDQTITGLAQGRKIEGNVLFLGGPLFFLKGLQERFVKTLGLSPENAFFLDLAPYFVALGSAYYCDNIEDKDALSYDELMYRLCNMEDSSGSIHTEPALFQNEQEYIEFKARHDKMTVKDSDIKSYRGKAYLGIDSGSTTTKMVLIDEDGGILYKYYSTNEGNPVPIIREQIEKIYSICASRIEIAGSSVTGYGEELMKAAFGIDHGIVETVAHYTAAKHFNPDVDFIIDIGGQDIKCFTIRDDTIDSVILNEACSSGCGSFIETFAKSLGYPIDEFARLALAAKAPVDLGTRCTVFMNSSVKQAQKDGASIEDISAGLALSVVKNAIYKVIRVRNADELGENLVVQGGTFLNDAVLRSFERELGKNVVRLSISELMGAYGAALYAMRTKEVTGLIPQEEIKSFEHSSTPSMCRGCNNRCSLTVNTFKDSRRFITGNKCELGAGGKKADYLPNLMEYKFDYVYNYPLKAEGKVKIGLPLVLNMYENLPFWAAFFAQLDCEVVVSGRSTRKLYIKGQHTIPSDTVCYPAKLVHGHIIELVEKNADIIFYPCMTYNLDEGISDNSYNCPVVAYYPELIKANMTEIENTVFIGDHLSLGDKAFFEDKIYGILKAHLPWINKNMVKEASGKGYNALRKYREAVIEKGNEALEFARENGKTVIIMASRPYHVDPEINHGIDKLLTSLDFVIVTEDAVSARTKKMPRNVLNQWTYHARMYSAAQYTGENDNMEMVQLVSFGCGLDAVTTDEVRDILRHNKKLYTQLKIDEINNLGAVKIRLRSLEAAIKEREKEKVESR